MSKKVNTVLFILAATLFNIAVTVLCFMALLLFYSEFLMARLPEKGRPWGFPVIFIVSLTVSFFVYRIALKALLKKIQPDRFFGPVFGGRPE